MWLNQPSESLQKEKDSQKWVQLHSCYLPWLVMVSICVGTCSVLKCWQMSNFTSAFGLEFINSRFGSLFRLPRVPIRSLLYLLYWSWVPISKLAGFRNRGMWGPGDLKGPFLSIVTPIEEKNANYSQITYACQDFWFIKSFIQFLLAK